MRNNSRTKNAFLNIIFGYFAQIGIMVLAFVGRRVFLQFLSADYLGINGLYSNILTILSLPELGLDTAVVYSLYKPVALNDNKMIISLLSYFRKIYWALSICIYTVGLCLIPFLHYIIKSDLPSHDLVLYYILFLTNTVSSYFVAHKVALLSASQEQRIQKIIALATTLLLQIGHICILAIWANYYLYLIATLVSTIISNLILGRICARLHSDVFSISERVEIDKKPIVTRIKATFLYKIGAVLINSTDNILISVLVSTIAVGFYSNYFTIISSVQAFIAIITTALISGIGNLAVNENSQKQIQVFDAMLLFYHTIGALGLVGFSLLSNEFVTMWLGQEYVYDWLTTFIISFNFYISNAISPIWIFREANGLFVKVKYLILIRAAINLMLSVLFGVIWGTFGILLATAVSLLLTSFWYEPKVLFQGVMKTSQRHYWKKQIKYVLATVVSFLVCFFSVRLFYSQSIIIFVFKVLIVFCVVVLLFIIVSIKTPEFNTLYQLIIKWIRKPCKSQP